MQEEKKKRKEAKWQKQNRGWIQTSSWSEIPENKGQARAPNNGRGLNTFEKKNPFNHTYLSKLSGTRRANHVGGVNLQLSRCDNVKCLSISYQKTKATAGLSGHRFWNSHILLKTIKCSKNMLELLADWRQGLLCCAPLFWNLFGRHLPGSSKSGSIWLFATTSFYAFQNNGILG